MKDEECVFDKWQSIEISLTILSIIGLQVQGILFAHCKDRDFNFVLTKNTKDLCK